MIRIRKHDLGISTSGWTRYQMHLTGSDLNVALARTENPRCTRSIQGHSGIPRVDSKLFSSVSVESIRLPYRISEHLQVNRRRRTERWRHQWSQRKESTSLVSTGPFEISLPDFIEFSANEPRMVHYKYSKKLDLDAVYTFGLKIAPHPGLTFFQTGIFAIILYNRMPSEASARVVKFSK